MLNAWFAERGIALSSLSGDSAVALRFSTASDEHLATRRRAGLFDFSFMGGWEVFGRGALAFLHRLQTRNLNLLARGRIAYTLLCRDDGTVTVDATIWCVERNRYWLFTGRRSDHAHLASIATDFEVEIAALLPGLAVIALQGPASFGRIEALAPGVAAGLPYFGFRQGAIAGIDAWIGRLGYTGEVGYEILVSASAAIDVWKRIAQSAGPDEVRECGWECANALRIEAGYVHFAFELAGRVLPRELGLARWVDLDRFAFIGRDALLANRRRPAGRRLVGVALDRGRCDHPPPRATPVRSAAQLTSEACSPVFNQHLALAF
ncbi:MAG: aminomethyltransferase family protein, partial [Betaproteobacteria bacterium]